MFKTLEKVGCPQYRLDENGILQIKKNNNWQNINLKKTKNGLWFENRNAKKRYLNIGEVMLEVFVGECPAGHRIEYINENHHDVRLDNIRWSLKKQCTRCKKYKMMDQFTKKSIYCRSCKSQIGGWLRQFTVPDIELTEGQKGYLAGLIDGEGWVGIQRNTSKKSGNYNYVAKIIIGNTNKKIIAVKEEIGHGYIHLRKSKNPKHKNVFIWVLSSNAIRAILPLVLPYLRIKSNQAELLMSYLSLATQANLPEKKKEYLCAVDAIYLKLRQLNKKGS